MTAERYERHSLIDWFDQDLVSRQRILVVGAGAVGNEVIKNLALLGVGEIHIFDQDVIEIHNLTRSVLFRQEDIGRPKATCAAQRTKELDPSVKAFAHVGDFWTTLTFSHLQEATAVFCCVDNFEARIRLSRLCAIAGKPLVNIGIDSRFGVVELFPFDHSPMVPCYECGLPPAAYGAIAKRYSCGWLRKIALDQKKIPTTVLTSGAAASLAVSLYLQRAMSGGALQSSFRYFQDTFTGNTTRSEITARSGCPGCGDLRETRIVVRADRRLRSLFPELLSSLHEGRVLFSDRILTHVRCRTCDTNAGGETMFDVADKFDETLAMCPHCGERAREVGLRDEFDVRELLNEYGARAIPGKFLMCTLGSYQIVIELEGDSEWPK